MSRRILFLLLFGLVLLAAGAVWVASSPRNPHDFAEQCESCHMNVPQGPGEVMTFNYDIDYVCNYCHEIPDKNSHPSLIVPSMAMPAGFPLDWEGRMTCATCHNPHLENWGENPALLRGGGVKGRRFCALCHDELKENGSRHRISEIVHAKNALSPTYEEISGVIDRVSLECITCHDGSVGKAINVRSGGEATLTYNGRSMNHPIGMNYALATQYNDRYHPIENLSPLIMLVEGKVGCVSCHNPYSHELTMLVLSNKGSGLCTQCHNL